MQALYEQLTAYYDTMRNVEENNAFTTVRDRIYDAMEEYRKNHPNASAVVFKSELHSQIAKWFEPVIFDELPFYYEMGVRPAENWEARKKVFRLRGGYPHSHSQQISRIRTSLLLTLLPAAISLTAITTAPVTPSCSKWESAVSCSKFKKKKLCPMLREQSFY